ncbi:MAG: ferrochelatase [Chlamydiota bacterium]
MKDTGILLVNLGTPKSPNSADVKEYLHEFLTDGRVIDVSWPLRQLLTRGLIVPRRYKESAQNYQQIWTDQGSPLMVHGLSVKRMLQEKLGDEFLVELAMRYQEPSMVSILEKMKSCSQIVILPLFPQYASATTGSVHQKAMDIVKKWQTIPLLTLINSYPTEPKMIEAFCALAKQYDIDAYDYVLLSFHGLPERQLRKADLNNHCLQSKECCKTFCEKNASCYGAQCHATAKAIAEELNLDPEKYGICFQSRLGKDPWIKPYTSDVLQDLVSKDCKKVLVICPAFVSDCVETIHEISVEYQEEFLEMGGEKLDLVRGLNDHPLWIDALVDILMNHVSNPTKHIGTGASMV